MSSRSRNLVEDTNLIYVRVPSWGHCSFKKRENAKNTCVVFVFIVCQQKVLKNFPEITKFTWGYQPIVEDTILIKMRKRQKYMCGICIYCLQTKSARNFPQIMKFSWGH